MCVIAYAPSPTTKRHAEFPFISRLVVHAHQLTVSTLTFASPANSVKQNDCLRPYASMSVRHICLLATACASNAPCAFHMYWIGSASQRTGSFAYSNRSRNTYRFIRSYMLARLRTRGWKALAIHQTVREREWKPYKTCIRHYTRHLSTSTNTSARISWLLFIVGVWVFMTIRACRKTKTILLRTKERVECTRIISSVTFCVRFSACLYVHDIKLCNRHIVDWSFQQSMHFILYVCILHIFIAYYPIQCENDSKTRSQRALLPATRANKFEQMHVQ